MCDTCVTNAKNECKQVKQLINYFVISILLEIKDTGKLIHEELEKTEKIN